MNSGPRPSSLGALLRAGLPTLPQLPHGRLGKVLGRLCACGTGELGAHHYRCARCQNQHVVAHRCRDRHCPDCQGKAAGDWLQSQEACLLPVPYFHVVFTLPHVLNPLIRQNRRSLLNLLFEAATATLLEFGRKKFKVTLGLTVVLHTWGQTLIEHYHVHVIVCGGGLSQKGDRWVSVPAGYLFNVHALAQVFRGKFCGGLHQRWDEGQLQLPASMSRGSTAGQTRAFRGLIKASRRQAWNVYCKPPFAGPRQVLAYLSRYTHRVAIGSRRLCAWDVVAQTVSFTYKNYARAGRTEVMTLGWAEFIRRFSLHILPERFVKIRHYGLLGNRGRQERLRTAREFLSRYPAHGQPPLAPASSAGNPDNPDNPPLASLPLRCPFCGAQALQLVAVFWTGRNRGPQPLDSS